MAGWPGKGGDGEGREGRGRTVSRRRREGPLGLLWCSREAWEVTVLRLELLLPRSLLSLGRRCGRRKCGKEGPGQGF